MICVLVKPFCRKVHYYFQENELCPEIFLSLDFFLFIYLYVFFLIPISNILLTMRTLRSLTQEYLNIS